MGDEEATQVKLIREDNSQANPMQEVRADDSRALIVLDQPAAPATPERHTAGSVERDAVFARVHTDKRMSLIKAWEDSEKSKAANRSQKKMSSISSWEKSKLADLEAELKKSEEAFEKKKAEHCEKMRNKIAMVHKEAEVKRAMVEADRGEALLKAEEMAAKYRATGLSPKKSIGCFGAK